MWLGGVPAAITRFGATACLSAQAANTANAVTNAARRTTSESCIGVPGCKALDGLTAQISDATMRTPRSLSVPWVFRSDLRRIALDAFCSARACWRELAD